MQIHKALRSEGPVLGLMLCWCHLEIFNTFEQVVPHSHFLDGRRCYEKSKVAGDRETCGERWEGWSAGPQCETVHSEHYTRVPS